jgi:hypothetical protein
MPSRLAANRSQSYLLSLSLQVRIRKAGWDASTGVQTRSTSVVRRRYHSMAEGLWSLLTSRNIPVRIRFL